MAPNTLKKYEIGDLVKWYQRCGGGFLHRDEGCGIIVRINDFKLQNRLFSQYRIYRFRHKDFKMFESIEIEKITPTHGVL